LLVQHGWNVALPVARVDLRRPGGRRADADLPASAHDVDVAAHEQRRRRGAAHLAGYPLGTLSQFGLPLQGIAVILGVDALMDMARTSLNLLGNCLATVLMARW